MPFSTDREDAPLERQEQMMKSVPISLEKENMLSKLNRLEKEFEEYKHQSLARMDKLEQMIRELGMIVGI